MSEQNSHTPLVFFGTDLTRIPHFRSSVLNGVYTAVGAGLLTFLCTSRPKVAMHATMGTYFVAASAYFTYNRWKLAKEEEACEKIARTLQGLE